MISIGIRLLDIWPPLVVNYNFNLVNDKMCTIFDPNKHFIYSWAPAFQILGDLGEEIKSNIHNYVFISVIMTWNKNYCHSISSSKESSMFLQ